MIRRFTFVTLAVMLLVMGAGQVFANGGEEESEEQVFQFRYANQQPENHSRTISMLWFAEEVMKRSDGRIQVEVFHSGVLGTEKEMFELVATGALDGYRGAFYDQLNPQFFIYNLPFLFANYEEMKHFNASDMAKDMLKKGSVQGYYMPAIGFTGLRAHINKERLIMLPEDLEGLKVRSPGQAPILSFYRLFGANPQEIAWAEVYLAVRQGVVDGADNSPTNILAAKLYEVANYFTSLNYMAGADPFMVRMEWYQSLPSDLQKIFDEVSVEALAYWDDLESEASLEAIKEISNQDGVEGVNLSDYPENVEIWAEAAQPLWQQFVDEGFFTWDDIRRAQAIIAEVRK